MGQLRLMQSSGLLSASHRNTAGNLKLGALNRSEIVEPKTQRPTRNLSNANYLSLQDQKL